MRFAAILRHRGHPRDGDEDGGTGLAVRANDDGSAGIGFGPNCAPGRVPTLAYAPRVKGSAGGVGESCGGVVEATLAITTSVIARGLVGNHPRAGGDTAASLRE